MAFQSTSRKALASQVSRVRGGYLRYGDPRAPADAVAVRRLLDDGAILLGATNVPLELMDSQSFNDIYGVSNNPWDLARTPGGSSGGTAASLAAGMAFFSIGSDIGGSIRGPASFCGICGTSQRRISSVWSVTRLGVLTNRLDSLRYLRSLDQWRVAPMISRRDCGCLPDRNLRTRRPFAGRSRNHAGMPCATSASAMCWTIQPHRCRWRPNRCSNRRYAPAKRAGATIKEGWPRGFRFRELLDTYFFLLGAVVFSLTPPQNREHVRSQLSTRPEQFVEGALGSFAEWQQQNMERLAYRAMWEMFFESIDVFLLPTTFTAKACGSRVQSRAIPSTKPRSRKEYRSALSPRRACAPHDGLTTHRHCGRNNSSSGVSWSTSVFRYRRPDGDVAT